MIKTVPGSDEILPKLNSVLFRAHQCKPRKNRAFTARLSLMM